MIAITGANGQLGRATVDYLTQIISPSKIIAVVRDPNALDTAWKDQVQVRCADYAHPETLDQALAGVSILLQISSTITGAEGMQQERNVAEAAARAGVQHIIYTSSLMADTTAEFTGSRQAAATEAVIRNSGMSYTFFRNSLYMEMILQIAGEVFEGGDICYPAKYARMSFVSRNDIAEALALVIQHTDKHRNQTYEITGPAAWSMFDVCEMLRQERKLFCRYISIEEEEYRDVLRSLHFSPGLEEQLCSMAAGISVGEFSLVDDALEQLLGRKRTGLPAFIKGIQLHSRVFCKLYHEDRYL